MKKKTLNYIQFTKSELDEYTRNKNSCVEQVNNSMHISFPPWGMDNFKDTLLNAVAAKKIGHFDEELNGIVLDVRNIKLEGEMSLLRYDTPELHLTIRADFYVFRPQIGVTLKGIVKHVSQRHVSVLIYRVFNVSIRLQGGKRMRMLLGDEIAFKVKKFDLQNILPYIEGELVEPEGVDSGVSTSEEKIELPTRKVNFSSDSESESETEFKSIVVKNEANKSTKSSTPGTDSSSSESDEDEPPSAPIVVKNEVSKRTKSSTPDSDSSSSESDEKAPPPKPINVKKEKVKKEQLKKAPRSKFESLPSDSDDSGNETHRKKIAEVAGSLMQKMEKAQSPEKIAFSKMPESPSKRKKTSVTVKQEELDGDLRLPPINNQIRELISRYSQSSDTDTSASGSSRKKKKVKTVAKRQSSPESSTVAEKKKARPSTPMKTTQPADSDSDSDEDFDMRLDMNSSITQLLNKLKHDNVESDTSMKRSDTPKRAPEPKKKKSKKQ
ncbi:probable DNA-directed RNA polymerase I subunit RPA43 [Phlebotomus argentipes]|uniref:probable DNA-directed RNA polymerase I subunit RPA43 n=1 Tax=Phlebotomus argentipes TaxID=94469 RepID=UPI0028933261|nr:probable DNA-directed RNA polymerase I subunit RPA43 [Phlebotomus argentipes]